MSDIENKYISLFKKLKKLDDDDMNEDAHILQDKIYRKFIKDVANNKFSSMKSIKKVAECIKKNVVSKDKDRWYA